jgi:hypothetical protein
MALEGKHLVVLFAHDDPAFKQTQEVARSLGAVVDEDLERADYFIAEDVKTPEYLVSLSPRLWRLFLTSLLLHRRWFAAKSELQ